MSNTHSVHQRTYDTLLEVEDGAGAFAASGAGSDIVDLGGNGAGGVVRGHNIENQAVCMGDLLLEVTALEVASNDEIYDIVLQFSNTSDFSDATDIQEGPSLSLGSAGGKRTDCNKADAVGRYIIPWRNEFDGTCYRYARVYVVVGGTVATGITFTGRLAKMFQN